MTAAAFADLVRARPTGRGKWQARCPAHRDLSPSLAIKEGVNGRVLVRCWAGCELSAIVASLSLTMRDLFNDGPADLLAIEKSRRERLAREAAERDQAATERRLNDYIRRGHFAVMALGARLARTPEDDTTAELLHTALDWLRIAESGIAA